MIEVLRSQFNRRYTASAYRALVGGLERTSGTPLAFRVAETPVFLPRTLLDGMAAEGAELLHGVLDDAAGLDAARKAIPVGYRVAGETPHPHFLTADFALVRGAEGGLEPRLVEIQAFPSVFGFQSELCNGYRSAYGLAAELECYSGGMSEAAYWALLRRTIIGRHAPENVVLTEVDPMRQKTAPDFLVTARKLGIAIVDIASLEPQGRKLYYRNGAGQRVPIHRIYNRAIVDELLARRIRLQFDLERAWDVEWAGHPNWYFLVSKFSIPGLARRRKVVPPAVFLDDFLAGPGREWLADTGVLLPQTGGQGTVYTELLLKPLFSFAGKGIQFEPTQALLESIPSSERGGYLLQQRMYFEPTIATPCGATQAEIRILYAWPDGGSLTPAMSLVRLGRGKMMGVDHNRNQEWVGASAAFIAPLED